MITDGVFSMDGDVAKLPEIVEIAEEFGLLTMLTTLMVQVLWVKALVRLNILVYKIKSISKRYAF